MRAQCLDVFPQAGARFRFRREARERIQQRTVFRWLLVEKAAQAADSSKWQGNDIEKENKWKGNDPPECFEEFSHVCSCRPQWGLQWVIRAVQESAHRWWVPPPGKRAAEDADRSFGGSPCPYPAILCPFPVIPYSLL